jgi:RHS repeat-associated protein
MTTYTWNARNQLTGISGPGVSATFVYDGLGRREKKTINSNVTEFLYDRLNPVQETSAATILANILPGLGIDEFLTRTDVFAGVTSNFLMDALGSPIAVTDSAGTVQTEYAYEPFGRASSTGASNSSSYQYTGRENDGTGMYYYRTRYYHPQLSRFIKEDSINAALPGENLYAYAYNNPIVFTDPMGLAGMAFGLQGQFINDKLLDKPFQWGFGFYVSDKECGFYFSKAISGSGYMAGIGLNISGFSGANPFGTANNFQAQAGLGLGFSYDDNYNIEGLNAGLIGPGVGAAWTRDKTTPLLRFRFACPRCPS